MMLENIDAAIFDLDGTLVDSMWLWHDIDKNYLARFNQTLPNDYQKCVEGMSFTETAIYTKERFHIPDPIEKMMHDWNEMAYDLYMNKVTLKKGAREFLKFCKMNRIKMGIATSNSHEIVDHLIVKLNIDKYLSCVVTSCDVNKGKPAPDVYLKAAEKLSVEPGKCLIFEDIPAGIMAGVNAGMKTCAVDDLYSKDQIFEKKRLADYFIKDYTQILENSYEKQAE